MSSFMSLNVPWHSLLFILASGTFQVEATDPTRPTEHITIRQGEDGTLPCTAHWKKGVQYRTVRWYTVGEYPDSKLSGLLLRSLPGGITQWYVGVERDVQLVNDTLNIRLSNLTCRDGGWYQCFLAAPVGERNQEGLVLLTVTGCPEIMSLAQVDHPKVGLNVADHPKVGLNVADHPKVGLNVADHPKGGLDVMLLASVPAIGIIAFLIYDKMKRKNKAADLYAPQKEPLAVEIIVKSET